MRKSPKVAVGRAASDATTAELSIFVAGSLASQSPKKSLAGRMQTPSACIFMPHATNPRARHTLPPFVDSRGRGKVQLTS